MLSKIGQIPFSGAGVLNMQTSHVDVPIHNRFKSCCASHCPTYYRCLLLTASNIFTDKKNSRIASGHHDLVVDKSVITKQFNLHFSYTPTWRSFGARVQQKAVCRDCKTQDIAQL